MSAEFSRPPLSYLSPRTIVRESPIQGHGLFAREAIDRQGIMKKIIAPLFLASLLASATPSLRAEEGVATLEEIIVEAPFDVRLESPSETAVQIMIERMRLRSESEREAALKIADRDPVSRLLDLTKYSPISLGAGENRVDTFFLQNSMRPDLNPRRDDPLSLRP